MEYPGHTVTLRTCPDCAVLPGYPHTDGCDVARCPLCGMQRLQCYDHQRSVTPAIWTGIWPGELECVEYGLWCKWVDGKGWVEPVAGDFDLQADLNMLAIMAAKGEVQWDRRLQRYVKPSAGIA